MNRRLLSRGVRVALRTLRQEWRILPYHKAALKRMRRFEGQAHLMLHLGCGPKHKPGWINIDLEPGADLQLDLREDLPFAEGTVAVIYSEHFFEHLAYPRGVVHLLREAMRVLEPDGLFVVGVPDAAETLTQYARGELPALFVGWARDENLRGFPPWVWTTPMHYVNYCFRQDDEHKYAYDFETLAQVLKEAGFVDVRRRAFDPDIDSEDRRDETLYGEACKPDQGEAAGVRPRRSVDRFES